MVTGDQHAIAVETSRRLGLGTDIMEGAELMAAGVADDHLINKVGVGAADPLLLFALLASCLGGKGRKGPRS